MHALTITLEPDELAGLRALVEIGRRADGWTADGSSADAASLAARTAKSLFDDSLAAKLTELGLPWAPTPEEVKVRADRAAQTSGRSNFVRALTRRARVRTYGTAALMTGALVVLLGGYAGGWNWTGFPANNQLWDWLNLLLLPVVIGTVPIWLLHAARMSRARRRSYGVFVLAFAGFVIVGYLVPLGWTGFRGNTLWNWFLLIVLPLTIVVAGVWPKTGRALRAHHKMAIALLAVGWVLTLFGGYLWSWSWTGYQGNTLWDWLQLLLLPLVFPTILLPAALKWISGNAAQLATDARRRAARQS
jgi:hypothetical protein